MNLDEAIKMALEYEGKVHNTYLEAMDQATDDAGRRVFKTLCDEEKYHLQYLGERLEEWKQSGKITVKDLKTTIPTRAVITEGVEKLQENLEGGEKPTRKLELELLKKALAVESETSAFYRRMVEELDDEGKELFRRFVEIEEGHQAIVQAEIDCLSGTGVWFDTVEFGLEL